MKGSNQSVGEGVKVASPASSESSAKVVPQLAGEDMVMEAAEKLMWDFQKWITGPYNIPPQSDTYKKDIEEWELQVHDCRPMGMTKASKNHLEERLLDQAQARASYTPPPPFGGLSRSIPQGMIFDVQSLGKSLFCPIKPSSNGFFDFEVSIP